MDKLIKKKTESTKKFHDFAKKSTFKAISNEKETLFEKEIKILIVEDNQIVRFSLQEMLNILGYSADFACDAKDALIQYSADYHLILMDIEIPYLNGMEVTKIIRAIEKNNHLKNVPIIAMTSHHDEEEFKEKCLSAGMNGFSGKPNAMQLKNLILTYSQNHASH